MSINKEAELNPLSQLYDELNTILSGLVVKFSVEADKYETFETKKYSDEYIAAINKRDTYGYFNYTVDEYNAVGVYDSFTISKYQNGEIPVPSHIEDKLLVNRRESIISSYDEPNDYYRILNGLPPKTTKGGLIVTDLLNTSLLVVPDNDFELQNDPTSKRISESSAYVIMGNNLFSSGNYIHISSAIIQTEKSSYSRSFLIVPDDFPISKSDKVVFLRDVKSIFTNLEKTDIDFDTLVGNYIHINLNNAIDVTSYYRNSFLVVDDSYELYDKDTMIKLSEAKLNNNKAVIGDKLTLGEYYFINDELSEMYGISKKVPLHRIKEVYGNKFVTILESSGYLDKLIENNPKDEYLKHIGSKQIDVIKARNAKNFDILYMPNCNREIIQWVFSVSYSAARDYFVNTVYNYYYRQIYDYYDNFIGLAIVQMAITQTIAKAMKTAIDRDFYDENMVKMLFEMYNVPYYPNLPYQTQRRLVKNLNYLIQNKATTKVIYDIASILGYHDISVYKYYLVKERKFDSDGNLIYKDTTKVEPTMNIDGSITESEVVINDLEKMYDLYLQKVGIDETNFQVALTDESKRVDYDSVTREDPLWWDDEETFEEVYGDYTKYTSDSEQEVCIRHYNYRETKYLGVSISYKMSEVLYENILLLRLLFDKKDEISDIYVTLPKITGTTEISLFETIVYLCALISKQYKLTGEILTRYSSVMDVMGYITEDVDGYRPCDTLVFNFDLLTNAETYKQITEKPSRYLKPDERELFDKYLSVLTIDQSTVSEKVTAINEMFINIKGLGYFIGRKMSEADNLFEYRAWKDFYEALFIGQENASMFNIGNTGETAKTYLEYLQYMSPMLYQTLSDLDDTHIYTYIDHTISRLETVVHDLRTLYTVNDSNSAILDYLIKLIKFFKSYTTDLIDVTTEYIFDMRPDNLFKLVEYYKLHQVIMTKDAYKLMYSDTAKIIETTKEIDASKYEDIIMLMKQSMNVSDIHSLSIINCSNCKNFNNCRYFCHNDKANCDGTYRVGTEYYPCEFYGYNTEYFYNYICKYRDLLITIDTGNYADLSCAIKSHLKQAYSFYKVVSDYNVFSGEEFSYHSDKMKEILFESLDKINELLVKYDNDIAEISDAGVNGIIEWIDLLTSPDSDIEKVCLNKRFPCRNSECEHKEISEHTKFEETLYHNEVPNTIEILDFYSTVWFNDGKILPRDEIVKVIQNIGITDSSKLLVSELTKQKIVLDLDSDMIEFIDSLMDFDRTDVNNDKLSFIEYLRMYEEV